MRKIILNIALSLDGFLEGPNGEYDWCFTDQDYGMNTFLEEIDTILFGRKSYELLEKIDPEAWPGNRRIVFSKTIEDNYSKVEIIRNDVENRVKQLKEEPGKDIWLFGGADLSTTFFNAGLIDELLLAIHPVLLGSGNPFYKNMKKRTGLKLLSSKIYSSGLIMARYKVL